MKTTATTAPRFFDVATPDGTTVRAWTNDAAGPTIFLSNGLGTSAWSWPSLLHPDCGFNVISWNHRGTGGSQLPRHESITMDLFVSDTLAVMNHVGLESAVFAAWSAGVNVAFEIAVRHPERIDGILAVGGVPGNTVGTMFQPLRIPVPIVKASLFYTAQVVRRGGRLARPVTQRIPWNPTTADLVRWSHFVFPRASSEQLADMLREFFLVDPAWYAQLALGVMAHERVSLSKIDVPVTFLAGSWDLLAGARDMRTAAQRVPQSRFRELTGSHFIPMEYPAEILDELRLLLDRVAPATGHLEPAMSHMLRAQ